MQRIFSFRKIDEVDVNLLSVVVIFLGSFFLLRGDHSLIPKKEFLGELAGFINLVAYFPYFVSIFRGETKPNFVTWLVWTFLELLIGGSYILGGADNTKWLPIASFFGMFLTVILSIFYGKRKWEFVDKICLIGSLIGINIWVVSGNPGFALLIFLSVDLLAAIPTLIKSKKHPQSEDLFAWILTLLSGFINILAVDKWIFSIVLLPLYNLMVYLMVVSVLIFSRVVKKV